MIRMGGREQGFVCSLLAWRIEEGSEGEKLEFPTFEYALNAMRISSLSFVSRCSSLSGIVNTFFQNSEFLLQADKAEESYLAVSTLSLSFFAISNVRFAVLLEMIFFVFLFLFNRDKLDCPLNIIFYLSSFYCDSIQTS